MIKVINKRRTGGHLFHYAHFLCDCLFPEIVCDVYNYSEVIREKSIDQTLGNFDKIYSEVSSSKCTELIKEEFDDLDVETIIYKQKEEICDKISFEKFRNFVFSQYKINPLDRDENYPEVLLIKRGHRVNLINDEQLNSINNNYTNGKERREINEIDKLEEYLKNHCNSLACLYFENMDFEKQIKYFNNAKMIICAHGAVMSNMFFCKESTFIIEVTCGQIFHFFDNMSEILNLKHIKCNNNELSEIIELIPL